MSEYPSAASLRPAPTPEQAGVVRSRAKRILVNAYAGTGKTSTAVAFAEARPTERILYMAFNTAMAQEAAARFPRWTTCRTMNSLAWRAIVPRLFGDGHAEKVGDMRPIELARVLEINERMARLVSGTLRAWLCSADVELKENCVPEELQVPDSQRSVVVELARLLFTRMCDRNDMQVKLPHDGYMKLWQISSPDLSSTFDRIICDEAQDLNPVVLDVLRRQTIPLLMIGDENQAIYQFRGATNAMRQIEVDERHHLTQSFRFGTGIAAVATALLGTYRQIPRQISGLGRHRTTLFKLDIDKTYCVIARTNAGLFEAAVDALQTGKPFHFVGGVRKYRFDSMLDAYNLMEGRRDLVGDRILRQFTSLAELKNAGDVTDDRELKFLVRVAEKYGRRIPKLVDELKRRHVDEVTPKALNGGIAFTTAHGSKGLEFDQVWLTDDYFDLVDDQESILPAVNVPEAELNLLYVAATRAERAIHLNGGLRDFLKAVRLVATKQRSTPSAQMRAGGITAQS
jgi:F-box protein, helicase, 18